MDGSSRMIKDGSSIRHRANSTSRCWPPDRLPAFSRGPVRHLGEQLKHLRRAGAASSLLVADGVAAEVDVLRDRHVPEQAVVLGHLHHAEAQDLPGGRAR